jgi:apolipoprotein N-acyltransferase
MSILTGVLLSMAWLFDGIGLLSLVSFIPLLYIDDYAFQNSKSSSVVRYFFLIYLGLFVWTLCSVWWLVNSTLWGLLIAVFFYPFYMTIPFLLSHIIKRKLGLIAGYFSLLMFWISFEWLTLSCDIAWPWLLLGNAFARSVSIIQWYDITGLLGGTVWILLSNILMFLCLQKSFLKQSSKLYLFITLLVISVPIVYSVMYYKNYVEKGKQTGYLIVQPNINPYTEKFSGIKASVQIQKMLNQAEPLVTQNIRILVLPETAITEPIFEETLSYNDEIKLLQAFIIKHPDISIVCGAVTQRIYNAQRDGLQNYHTISGKNGFYVGYNAALFISKGGIQITRKSKLLPGVETMPLAKYIPSVSKLMFDFGGQFGSFGTQSERTVFTLNGDSIATIICYEAEFGNYVGAFVRNGAESICSITNDGWWGNTPGYKQHLSFCCLRAIELRRDIARSANTGISCLINQRGDITNNIGYGKTGCIRTIVHSHSLQTFYAIYGDFIGIISIWLSLIMLLILLSMRKR